MATTPTQIQQTQVGFAPEIAPFATTLLGQAQAFADPNIPYEAYTGDRFAQFTPMQKQSYEGAQSMQPAYQLMGATGLAGLAGQQALNTSYRPMNILNGKLSKRSVMNISTAMYLRWRVERSLIVWWRLI